jgi:uncharacterized protein YjdB
MMTDGDRQAAAPRPIVLRAATILVVSGILYAIGCSGSTQPDDDVPCAVTAIAVNPATATVPEGEAIFLDVTIVPFSCEDRLVSWSSSDSSIATVSSAGRVLGIAEGVAQVMAQVDSLRATATITVEVPLPAHPRRSPWGGLR